ncbi:hypothetical protein GCM10017083_49520 [Thalassobaculum fulvum]|uniref:HTH cro/C1-type domain-containing protein n=1 Tax=Thalassobaculum fulvum TaxID=1633335 RepID=A0A919CS15_9PROT|nr:hypothetical protein GCM10017083_49520 [Thalassobaculum fulvum]
MTRAKQIPSLRESERPTSATVSQISLGAKLTSVTKGPKAKIFHYPTPPAPPAIDGALDIDTLVAEFAKEPEMAEALRDARQEFSKAIEKNEGVTLKSLRLRAGLSQMALAQRLGTSQACMSRRENGREAFSYDAACNWADEIKVDMNTFREATKQLRISK